MAAENEKFDPAGNESDEQPEILVNEYGRTRDPAVVVDEADRTVLLTPDETVIIQKQQDLDISPRDRPRKVYSGMWGRNEIGAVGLATLTIIAVMILWIFFVIPSNRELEATRAERDRLERDLLAARGKYGGIKDTKSQVEVLLTSVSDFELNYLPVEATGRNALYQRLNGLIAAHGLVNTSGPDYAPLETADVNDPNETDEERGRAKFKSLFPGVYVSTTVEGSYQNLRRFIREIETGNDFVLISSVELEPSESGQRSETAAAPVGPTESFPGAGDPLGLGTGGDVQTSRVRAPRGKVHGDVVSLRIEMAAYFRRPNFEMPVTQEQ